MDPGSIITLLRNTYEEEVESNHSIDCSQKAIVQRGERTWDIRVTCRELISFKTNAERRRALKGVMKTMDFAKITLFKDTVTQIRIRQFPPLYSSHYETYKDQPRIQYPFASRYTIKDGVVGIRHPSPTFPSIRIPAIAVDRVRDLDDINGHVFRVQITGMEGEYTHKTVDRPFDEPSDIKAFEEEILHLVLLRGIPNICQLVGVTVGKSLNRKDREAPEVIHGMVFRYYPGGTIKQLHVNNHHLRSWKKWLLQISRALREIHRYGIAHMDIKPSNIVLDAKNNAVLINLGGQSTTFKWLAPELCEKEDVLKSSTDEKRRGELWTLGKLFSKLIEYHTGNFGNDLLSNLAIQLMNDDPTARISLDDVIYNLESLESGRLITAS